MVDVDIQRPAQITEGDRVKVAGALIGFDDLAGFPDYEGQGFSVSTSLPFRATTA